MKYLFDRLDMKLVALLLLLLMWRISLFAPAVALPPHSCAAPGVGSSQSFASITQNEANMRSGASTDHEILWVFRRVGMPLIVLYKGKRWWHVRDWQGDSGWMHSYLLSSSRRTALVIKDGSVLWQGISGPAIAKLEKGVIGKLGQCREQWCELEVDGYKGWVLKSTLWGVDLDTESNRTGLDETGI